MASEGFPDPRNESEAERDDRNLAELLQELRVAGLGVKVLFGFLLSLPFTNRFTQPTERTHCATYHRAGRLNGRRYGVG